jgi:hypothetical protein
MGAGVFTGCADRCDRRHHRHVVAFFEISRQQRARHRTGHIHGRLIGLHLAQHIVHRNGVAYVLFPADDNTALHRIALLGHHYCCRHTQCLVANIGL